MSLHNHNPQHPMMQFDSSCKSRWLLHHQSEFDNVKYQWVDAVVFVLKLFESLTQMITIIALTFPASASHIWFVDKFPFVACYIRSVVDKEPPLDRLSKLVNWASQKSGEAFGGGHYCGGEKLLKSWIHQCPMAEAELQEIPLTWDSILRPPLQEGRSSFLFL